MLDHARVARSLVAGVTEYAYTKDRTLQLALERAMEIVGEAARRISESFKVAHPEISWRKIIGQRNVLAHEYDEISQELLWHTATYDLPKLIVQLESLFPENAMGQNDEPSSPS